MRPREHVEQDEIRNDDKDLAEEIRQSNKKREVEHRGEESKKRQKVEDTLLHMIEDVSSKVQKMSCSKWMGEWWKGDEKKILRELKKERPMMVSMNLEDATDKERQLMVSIAKAQRTSARSFLMEGKVQNMFWYEGEGARLKASSMSSMSSSGAYNKEKGHYLF